MQKWTKLSKVLATEDFVDGGSSNYQVITKSAFENQMHPTASFLGSLLFDHFQLGSSHRNSDKDPSVMTHAAFVSNVTHVLGLNSDTDQGEYYFRVFSKGADTLKEDGKVQCDSIMLYSVKCFLIICAYLQNCFCCCLRP